MNLRDYPNLVADAERAWLEQGKVCRDLGLALEKRKAEIEGLVANDNTLTNDAKRKAMRVELMGEVIMTRLVEQLQAAQDKLSELRIEADLIRDCFLVERLIVQHAIASKC